MFDENDAEIQQLLANKQQLHRDTVLRNDNADTQAQYREICSAVQQKLRHMQDKWWDDKATDVQRFADQHRQKDFYSSLKSVYGPTHSTTVPLKTADGTVSITEKSQILLRWKEHLSDLLNTPSNISDDALNWVIVQPECSGMDAAPTLGEVTGATSKLRNSKAPGSDGIPAEAYKQCYLSGTFLSSFFFSSSFGQDFSVSFQFQFIFLLSFTLSFTVSVQPRRYSN